MITGGHVTCPIRRWRRDVAARPSIDAANYMSSAIKVEAILDAHGLWCAVAPAEGVAVDADKSKTARQHCLVRYRRSC